MYKKIIVICCLLISIPSYAALTKVEVEDSGTFSGTWYSTTGTLHNFSYTYPMYSQVVYKASKTENDYYELVIPSGNTSLSVVMMSGLYSSRCTITITDPINGTQTVSGFNPKVLKAARYEDCPTEYLLTNNLSSYGAGPYTLRITVGAQYYYDSEEVAIDCVKYGNFNFGSVTGRIYPPTYAKSHYVLGAIKIGVYQGSSLITYGFTNTKDEYYKIYGLNTGTYTIKSADAKWGISTEQTVSVVSGSTTSVLDLYAVGHRIWSPGPGKPEIRKPKESFNIEFFGTSSCGSFTATLSNGYKTYAIPIEKVSYNSTWNMHTLKATIQSNVAESLYTLTVNSSEGNDSVVRAVKVVKEYKNKFYVIHSTDDHLTVDNKGILRDKVAIWNIIHPEFIIFTGDNINGGDTPGVGKIDAFMEVINECEIPTFVVKGNHDQETEYSSTIGTYSSDSRNREIAVLYWGAAVYSRNYGAYHFTSYDYEYEQNEEVNTDPEWINWWRADFSKAQGAKLRIVGCHENLLYNELIKDWNMYKINMWLYGHSHGDAYSIAGTTPTIKLMTAAGSGHRYRLIRIKDSSFVSWWV